MNDKTCTVLFLCTANSARPIPAGLIVQAEREGRRRAMDGSASVDAKVA